MGPIAAGPAGVEMEVAARTGLAVLGLAGLVVGLIRVVAIARADQRRRHG